MSQIDEQLRSLSDGALRRGVLMFAVVAFPAAFSSVARGFGGEWQPVFTLHILAFVVAATLGVLRHRLPVEILGAAMLCLCLSVGWAGLYTFGVAAPAGHWMPAVAIFLAGMLYAERGMVISIAVVFSGLLLITGLHLSGVIAPAAPPAELFLTPLIWTIELMVALLFMAIVLPSLDSFVGALRKLVAEVEQGRDKIAYLAVHDELTGLPRLSVVRDRLSSACQRNDATAGLPVVMFIDLDGFKLVNDNYGHEAGDACLRAVSARLKGRLRGQDTAARIGGDEFVVVLESVKSAADAHWLASELLTLLREPFEYEGRLLEIGASIGVAVYPENGSSAESLLRNADKAMYVSKRCGGNVITFATHAAAENDGTLELMAARGITAPFDAHTATSGLFDRWLDAIATRCIVVILTVLTLAVSANVWRIVSNQAAPNIIPTITALVLALLLFLGRDQVPLKGKMALTSGVGLLIALPGFFLTGLAGPGLGWALASGLFLVGIFYGGRAAKVTAAVSACAIALAGVGFVTGGLSSGFDVNQGTAHPATWLVFVLSAAAFAGITMSAWYLHKKTFRLMMEETTAQIADLLKLATYDEITGLPSLRLANDRLVMACRRAQRARGRVAIMLVDLDGFKAVNDTLGHDAGDYCLREIGGRMSANVRDADTVARVGGDEFLVLVETVDDVEVLAETGRVLIDAIAQPLSYEGQPFSVTASVGIAVYPDHGIDGESLRQAADAAMYTAKEAGKNDIGFAGDETVLLSASPGHALSQSLTADR